MVLSKFSLNKQHDSLSHLRMLLKAALNEEDLKKVSDIVADCKTIRFDCGRGIHIEKPKEFIKCLIELPLSVNGHVVQSVEIKQG